MGDTQELPKVRFSDSSLMSIHGCSSLFCIEMQYLSGADPGFDEGGFG